MKNLSLWQFGGFASASLLGTTGHFLYNLFNQSLLVAPFSSVNESTWEHMKLIYFPMLVFALFQVRYFKDYEGFWCVKLIGIFCALILIPLLFYSYKGALGFSSDFVNILIFFVSAALSLILENHIFKNAVFSYRCSVICLVIILLIGALFVIFTFAPPHIPLFLDPQTKTYGIKI